MASDPTCQHTEAPAGARFCPQCGASLAASPAPSREHRVQIDQQVGTAHGKVTGLEVGRIEGNVTLVQGHVIQIDNPSAEVVERLMAARLVDTEVSVGSGQTGLSVERIRELGAELEDVHRAIQRLERRGDRIDEIDVGEMRIGRVELLLKQAVLLKAEADQMFLDQIGGQRAKIDDLWSHTSNGRATIDLNDWLQDFDADAHEATLRKAETLLEEARTLEPHNAEVLLHLAQVMEQLEEAPEQIDKLLYSVIKLLEPPRSDTDKFHLAQAVFLSATLRDGTPHPDMLNKARMLFTQLGRSDWVEQCDLVAGHQGSALPAAHQAALNPAGHWRIQISDGSHMDATLQANGSLQGQQHHPMMPMPVPFNGMWGFDPQQSLLSLQGVVGGMNPFFLNLYLQGQPDGSLVGAGTDGHQYRFMRLGQP